MIHLFLYCFLRSFGVFLFQEISEDQFQDRREFVVNGLKDYRFKMVWTSSFMGVKAL